MNPDSILSRTAVCPDCGRDLRVCKNCRFYAPGSHHDCREPQADFVKDKERSNFCDYFSVNPTATALSGRLTDTKSSGASARDVFNNLFGL